MKIIYTKTARTYLQELVKTLYEKNYFGFEEFANKYVDSLTTEIESTIHIRSKRKASNYFSRYGKDLWYVFYSHNKRTT